MTRKGWAWPEGSRKRGAGPAGMAASRSRRRSNWACQSASLPMKRCSSSSHRGRRLSGSVSADGGSAPPKSTGMTSGPPGSRRRSRAISTSRRTQSIPGPFRPLREDALPAGRDQHQDNLGRVQRLFYLLWKDLARLHAPLVIEQRLGIEPQPQPVPQSPGVPLGIGTAVGEDMADTGRLILVFLAKDI